MSEPLWGIEARNAAIANGYYVCAINRVGTEIYEHEYENENGDIVLHKDSGQFFGSSYISAPNGSRSPVSINKHEISNAESTLFFFYLINISN